MGTGKKPQFKNPRGHKTVYSNDYADIPTKLTPEQYPKKCVKIIENPNKNSVVKWLFVGEDGEVRCSAKRSGWTPEDPKYCSSYPVEGSNGRCQYHGGRVGRKRDKSLTTISTAFRRYGKVVPNHLFEKYIQAAEDTELHSLNEEIALIDAKIADLLECAEDWGGEEILADVKEAFDAFRVAYKAKDTFKIAANMERLQDAVDRADHEAVAWKQITNLMELRRRLVIAEVNRQKLLEQFIPAGQVQNLIANIIEAIKMEVLDEAKRVAIQNRIGSSLGYNPSFPGGNPKLLRAGNEPAADGEVLDGEVE